MTKITTVLFDLDGTLLDTLDDLTDGVNFALSKFGFPPREPREIRSFIGRGIYNLIRRSVTEEATVEQTDRTFEAFREYYFTHCRIKTRPYAGINELVDELVKRGYKMAILSNKRHEAVLELGSHFFAGRIKLIYGEKPDVPRKPDPQIVLNALNELNSSPEETVFIGDSEVDVTTAQNAHVRSIAVTWGFRDRVQLEENAPDFIAETSEECFRFILNSN